MTNELFESQRGRHEGDLIHSAMELIGFMGVSALRVQIPDTNPPVYVYVGTEDKVRGLLK